MSVIRPLNCALLSSTDLMPVRGKAVALAPSELAGVAETGRVRADLTACRSGWRAFTSRYGVGQGYQSIPRVKAPRPMAAHDCLAGGGLLSGSLNPGLCTVSTLTARTS